MAISTNGTIITRLAGALYNEYLSNASYTELNATPAATVAANMLSSDFAGKTDLQIATTVLSNLGLSSVAGLNNWVAAQLTGAGSTAAAKGTKLVSMLNDFAMMTADATYGSYAKTFNDNTAAGLTSSQTAKSAGGAFATAGAVAAAAAAAEVAAAKAIADAAAAKVIADAEAAAAKVIADAAAAKVIADAAAAKVIADAEAAAKAPQSFNLTTGVDTGATFTGKDGADSYTATTTSTGLQTLTAGDSLSGGLGADTLNITNTVAATLGAGVTATGIETVNVTATAATTLDTSGFTGVTAVSNTGSTADVSVTGLKAIPAVSVTGANVNTTVGMTASVTAGAADAITFNVNGVATTANVSVTANGIETVNVASTGSATGSSANTLTVASDSLTTLAVTGDAAAKLAVNLVGASATTTGTVTSDAGAHDVAITARATDKLSVSMLGGNDQVRIDTVSATHTIAGGEGTDTLNTSAAITLLTGANISGFEAVSIRSGAAVALPIAANPVTTLTIADGAGGTLTNNMASGGTVNLTIGGNATLTNTAWTTPTTDSLIINVGAATTSGALGASLVTATGIETATINNLALSNNANTRDVGVSGANLKSLVVTGNAATIIRGGGVALTSIDASGVNGAVTFSATTAAAGASLIGGGVGDAIVGGTGADTINGGAGNDTITGGVGKDNLTGGTGSDTFVIAQPTAVAVTSNLAAQDTIVDFLSGTDKLSIAQPITAFLNNYTSLAAAQAAATSDGRTNLAFFVTTENTLYVSAAANGAINATTDTVIYMPGVTSLGATDFGLGTQGTGNTVSITAASANVSNSLSTGASAATTALDDQISISGATATLSTATIDGGAGTDTLTISTAPGTETLANTVSNVEAIVLTLGNTGTLTLPATNGLTVSSSSATAGLDVAFGGTNQSVTAATTGATAVAFGAAGQTVTSSGAGTLAATSVGSATGQTVTATGTGVATVTISAPATTTTVTLAAAAADVVIVSGSGTAYGSGVSLTAGTQTGVTDTLRGTTGPAGVATINLSAATLSGFETLDLTTTAATYNVTLTPAQNNAFTGLTVSGNDTITMSAAGAITGLQTATANDNVIYALTGTGNVFTAGTGTTVTDYDITGGTLATYNFGASLTAADTIAGGTGNDVLNITGNATGSANITGIETINFTTSTASRTFTTGAIALPAAGNITAAASTVAVAIDASSLDLTTSGTITDGPGNDTITATVANLERKLQTVSLASGGSDTVIVTDALHMKDESGTDVLGTTATSTSGSVTLGAAHGFGVGDSVAIGVGTALTGFAAGTYTVVTVPTTSSFTVTLAAAAAGTATGGGAVTAVGSNRSDFVTVTNFTSGTAAGADKLSLLTGTQAPTGYTVVTATGQAAGKTLQDNNVFEINAAVGVVTDFTAAAAAGAVELLLQDAIGTLTGNSATGWLVVYGGGAQAGNAGVYSFRTTSSGADVTAATSTVELVAVLTGVVADSLVTSNFI